MGVCEGQAGVYMSSLRWLPHCGDDLLGLFKNCVNYCGSYFTGVNKQADQAIVYHL